MIWTIAKGTVVHSCTQHYSLGAEGAKRPKNSNKNKPEPMKTMTTLDEVLEIPVSSSPPSFWNTIHARKGLQSSAHSSWKWYCGLN